MAKSTNEAKNPVKSAQNTLRILEGLRELDGAGVTELSEHLGIPKSSVHNYLSTLQQAEYVVKEGAIYHVGIRFLEFGAHARSRRKVYDAGKSEVQNLAKETGELANLLVEEHGRGVYIYREAGAQAVRVDAYVGLRVYLHNTALGKAILAHMPRERVLEIIDRHGLPKTAENTITDPDELFEKLAGIRDRGVAFDREERLDGLHCVAVPILDGNKDVKGAISISGPASRMKSEEIPQKISEKLRSAANVIELDITYS